ncbi:MAG TPA: PadR family transcriptional regulator [Candidatus Nanoarchaeia archaeon]|nr:PadR family transcriptional regulator [Candidatus Nanoarchaeia archaeon]
MAKCCEMKGFLSFMVLRMISKSNMSGECLREEIKKRKGTKPSSGTIYPVLKSLSENGFIREVKSEGKNKNYEITAKGKKELDSATKKFCEIFYDMRPEFDKCGCK